MHTTRRIAIALVAVVIVVAGIIFAWSNESRSEDREPQTGSSHLATPPGPSVTGHTSVDLFDDDRFFFQYKNHDWEAANAPYYDGVRQIAVIKAGETKCDVMERAKHCPRLIFIDTRSNYYKQQFGGAPVAQTLEREKCGLDGSKAGAFTKVGTITVLGVPASHYRQTLCKPSRQFPLEIHRHFWFVESEGLLVILEGADNQHAMMDVADESVEDVETSLAELQEKN